MEYEKRTGIILCHERIFNWHKRDQARYDKAERRKSDPKAKGRYIRGKSEPRRDRDWYKKHEHLPPDELRRARARRQQKELDSFAVKQAAALLKLDERLSRTLGKQRQELLAEIEKKKQEIKDRRSGNASLKERARDIFRKAVDNITLRAFLRNRAIRSMQKSADELGLLMEKWREEKREQLGRQWLSMEKRHAAERERDEQRIARRESQGRTEATGERGRRQFNMQGDARTARHAIGRPPVKSLKDTHAKAVRAKPARPAKSRSGASKGIFSMIAEGIGSIASELMRASSGKKQALGGMKQAKQAKPDITETIGRESKAPEQRQEAKTASSASPPEQITIHEPETVEREERKTEAKSQNQTAPDQQEQKSRSSSAAQEQSNGMDDYHDRVARRIEQLEKEEKKKRKRRKRKRPRGRRRKME
jgi:hypothetical protein